MTRTRLIMGWVLVFVALSALGASAQPADSTSTASKDTTAAKMPKPTEISYYYDIFEHSIFRPFTRALDASLLVRKVAHNPREAENVDEQDQVQQPCTWWQPRLGFRNITPDQLIHGTPGHPPVGAWRVTRAKTQGVTPGFYIKDAKGTSYIIKFDPPSNPEMATAADVIASYLFWGAGYNVPYNVVVNFRREDLSIGKDATYTDQFGHKKKLTDSFLDETLTRVPRNADGTYRAIASQLLSGKPLGPFEYAERREDDPEDQIPHEHRRELRGLWTIAAWTSHGDVRGPNSLDMWVTENGRSFVRHHLIDFGSCLGSAAIASRSAKAGHQYYIDYGVMARQLLTLGLKPQKWENTVDPELPSIGFIEAAAFNPEGWRPDYPNPAFDERTDRDIRWGARIVAGFTDEHIRAAVEQGRYSDPRATEYLTQVLIQRRDILVRRWLGDSYRAETEANGGQR